MTEIIDESERRRFHRIACLLIIFVGLAIYSNTIHSSFHFDDYFLIEDPLIKDLRNTPQFFQKNYVSAPGRGLVTTSLAINYYFSQLSVEGYHWTNISIHLLNGILVYFFAAIILGQYITDKSKADSNNGARGALILALFVALLFVSSPTQTHSVTYIIKRYAPMASFFYLLSLILFIKAVPGPAIKVNLYAGSILSLLIAVWCKETAYTAPIIMFLCYQCFIAKGRESLGKGLKLILPYGAILATSLYLTAPFEQAYAQARWGRLEYLLTQSNVLIEYLKLMLLPLPSRLNVDYDFHPAETLWEFPTLTSVLAISAILVTTILHLKKARLVAFSVLWFFIILAPTSSIIPLREIMVSYRLYLPGLGFYLLLVVGIHEAFYYLSNRLQLEPRHTYLAELAVLVSVVIFYSACTFEHNKVWKTDITLWEDMVKKSPRKIRPQYNLGKAYELNGMPDKAKTAYVECMEKFKKAAPFNSKLGLVYYYRAGLSLADICSAEGKHTEAIEMYENYLKVRPSDAKAHNHLGVVYLRAGDLERAEAEFKQSIQLNPKAPHAHCNLGLVYEKRGMPDKAIEAYTAAVRVNTKFTKAHMNLGTLLLNHKKDYDKALYHLEEALQTCTNEKTIKKLVSTIETIKQKTATGPSR